MLTGLALHRARATLQFLRAAVSSRETPGRFDQRIRGAAQSQLILRTGFVVVGNQDLDTVVAYTMDAGSGKLTKASELSFPAPVAVLIV